MKFPDVLDQLPGIGKRVYGEPYQTPDGTTVIPVARVRSSGPDHGCTVAPLGVFVVHGGEASWVAALDANRIGLIGVITGLLAAVIGSLAILRRPPWPDIRVTDYK